MILPINNRNFSESLSFINLGPLEKIDSLKKGLGPTIHADMASFAHCFSEVQDRLGRIKRSRRERIGLETFLEFVTNDKKRLLLVCDLINLFAPISRKELILFFRKLYGEERFNAVHFDIQVLSALSFVAEREGFLYSNNPNLHFVDFNHKYFQLKSDVILFYRKNFPERLRILGEVAANAI
jgi:hypothetical protein